MSKAEQPRYVLMDGRARHDFDRAEVFECCDDLWEAREAAPYYGDDTLIWDNENEEFVT